MDVDLVDAESFVIELFVGVLLFAYCRFRVSFSCVVGVFVAGD